MTGLWNARGRSRASAACAALALCGCAGFAPQPNPEPEPGGRYVLLTTPIVAIGDTQEHESNGLPLHDNDNAIDAFAEVTQRPPEQPLFGRRVMEWALQAHPGEPYIHLGDVLDLSCRSEASRIWRTLEATAREGAILPGNHDGLMFGIYGYNPIEAARDPGLTKWNEACRRGADPDATANKTEREAFTKRDFIATYLAGVGRSAPPGSGVPAIAANGEHVVSWRNPRPDAFLTAIESRLRDGAEQADSFVAQRLRLPRAPGADRDVIVIALDTNQAGPLVSAWDTLTGKSPGSVGHVRPEQVRAVRGWVDEAVRNGDIVIFAGHHNWTSLGLPSRVLLREVMSTVPHPLVYLSAHTHRGFWAVHRALDRRPLLELNNSSLSDWPIAFRRISIAYDERANRLLVRGDLMPAGDVPHQTDADLLAAWEKQTCARAGFPPDYLRMVERGLVERQRSSRGSLLQWLQAAVTSDCESCELDRYIRANAYQDEMLLALIEAGLHLGPYASGLNNVPLPAFCRESSWYRCAGQLLREAPTDLVQNRALFRRKARLVDLLGEHLDTLTDPEAKAYMTCRAVQAAKIDFDASDDNWNDDRGEAKRRSEQYFRIEASVGMN